jgi:uncharacterized protein (TIGR02271 family)
MELEERYAGYEVYDRDGEKIGKVDDLLVGEHDVPEYIGVKMGFLGMKSTLIPMELAKVDEERRRIEVSVDKARAKEGPAFDDDEEITPEYEEQVRSHYGLGGLQGLAERGSYGDYYPGEERAYAERREGSERHPGLAMGGRERGEVLEHPPSPEREGVTERGSDLEDEDELRVQRSEEELRAGTREREAGAMKVRKRVRTDREQIEVPTKHEEVTVERVPVEGEATEAQIGEDEVSVPVTEEEVVVDKRAVAKEEIRLRKEVVEDTETVEEDVRREEVEVEDDTERGSGTGL